MPDAQHIERTVHSSAQTLHEEPRASLFSNILAIAGFIILIVIVVWGLVHLASISRDWFSSLFGTSSTSTIEVTTPATATSATPFTVSWKYSPPVKGTYAFLYSCKSGFQFQTPGPSGTANGIPCGAAFTVLGTDNKLSVTPLLNATSSQAVSLSIIFMPSASGTQAQGNSTVTVNPLASAVPQATPAPTPTPTPVPISNPAPTPAPQPLPAPSPRPHKQITSADLSVRIISAYTDPSGTASVTFDIANVGGSPSGTYSFTAQLPTTQPYTYASPIQPPLIPGSHVVNTLRFTQAQSGVVSISINASDANKSNNYSSQVVTAPYTSYDYNNTFYPDQYQPQYSSQPYMDGYQYYSPTYQDQSQYPQYQDGYTQYYPYAY